MKENQSFNSTAICSALIFSICAFIVSCDVFDSETPNTPPEIQPINGEAIQVTPENPAINIWVALETDATDAEDDELRFFWEVKIAENVVAIEPLSSIEAQLQNGQSISQPRLSNRVKFLPTQTGNYHVAVSVVDSKGETVTVTRTLTVSESVETLPLEFRFPPIIVIGKQPLPVGEQATLVANPLILDAKLKYEWSAKNSLGEEVSGVLTPQESSPERHTFQSVDEGEFTISVKISDDSDRDPVENSLVITVVRENQAPVFNAQTFSLKPPLPADQPFFLVGETVEITATAVDEDENDQPALKYTWRVLLNGNQEITDTVLRSSLSSTNTVFFQASGGGIYAVETTVSDGRGGKDKTFLQLHVNTPPEFIGGISILGVLSIDNVIELTASAEDTDGDALSYSWQAKLNTLDVTNEVFEGVEMGERIRFKTQNAGVYQITVTATDGKRGTAANTVFIDIKEPIPPQVEPELPQIEQQ